MNKRMLILGTAVAVSGVLLLTSAFAAMSTTSAGYEALKTAHKQAPQIGSLTTDAKLNVTDGGQSLVEVQSKLKFDKNNKIGSAVVHVTQNGETFTINGYKGDNELVIKPSESDTYFVVELDEEQRDMNEHRGPHNPVMAEGAERIIDALVGHNQNYFSLEKGPDHSSVVKLSMHDDEIPLLVNTLGSILIKNASKEHPTPTELPDYPAFARLHAVALPKLTEDIQLSGIEFTTVINADKFIEQYNLLIQASGNDAEGVQHELELKLQLNFSDFNKTVAEVVDLSGKQVEKLEKPEQDRKHGKRWH